MQSHFEVFFSIKSMEKLHNDFLLTSFRKIVAKILLEL